MAPIIIFAVSLSAASAFVLVKALDLKFGNENVILKLIRKLDTSSEKLVSSLKFRALQAIQTARYILQVQTRAYVNELKEHVKEKVRHEFEIRQNAVMGRKELATGGSASFYLKKITETKQNGDKGKIEESL